MKTLRLAIIVGMLFCVEASLARNCFVAPNGSDDNQGTTNKPFKTIQKSLEVLTPGDTCYIRGGTYRETVVISRLEGTPDKPIIFKNFEGEKVILDGSDPIVSKWTLHKGSIYKTKLKDDIWQLFVDGKSMSSARWPNANWDDGSIWDKSKSMMWPEKDVSSFGHHINKELKELDFSLQDGGIVIVNSGSFKTYKSFVTEHKAGSNSLKFDTSTAKQHHGTYPAYKHGYFLEGKLGLLDTPGEWFYEPKDKTLYLWPPNGVNPNKLNISGKRRSYAFDVKHSRYLRVTGVEFFATTFRFEDCYDSIVKDCHLLYPAYSKRMLRDIFPMDVTKMVERREFRPAQNKLINCIIEYTDGPAIEMSGKANIVENNYIHDIDYSCTYAGGYTLNMIDSPMLSFRRNTIHTTGTSETLKAGVRNVIELNDISRTGYLQNDGSLIQISVKQQDRSETRNNWVHDSVKIGIRFDNSNKPGSPWGQGGRMHHNVAWKVDRLFFKGDRHYIYNNLAYDCIRNDLITSSDVETNGRNYKTITRNNIAGKLSGHRVRPGKDYPLPGIVDHNWAGNFKNADIRTQLRDPDNLDFRPKAGSELIEAGADVKVYRGGFIGKKIDIGPYEFGCKNYWIPGRQWPQASGPVPPNGTDTAKIDADIMWLAAYKSYSDDIYFGTSRALIEKADKSSRQYKGNQTTNIYAPGKLAKNTEYFWRIDSVVDGKTVKGNVWSFKTASYFGNK